MEMAIRARVIYAIRHQDVELAECFAARCPEVADLVEMNTFLHQLIAQYDFDTRHIRNCIDDTMDIETWLRYFAQDILPVMRQHRLPLLTTSVPVSPYAGAIAKAG